MLLGELLTELRDNQLRDKSDQVAGSASDQLWTDDTLIRYISQAQSKFATLTSCIRDASTPAVCQLKVVPLTPSIFSLHPSVIAVLSARYPDDHADLARTSHDVFNNYHTPDRRFYDSAYLTSYTPGKPLAYSTDEGMAQDDYGAFNTMTFRTYPDVGAGFGATIALRVIRRPINHLSTANLNARLEIPEHYHMDILDWAGYLALRGPDLDVAGGDGKGTADKLRASFMQTIKDAKRDMQRRMFAPMVWDFGRNGFSYERD